MNFATIALLSCFCLLVAAAPNNQHQDFGLDDEVPVFHDAASQPLVAPDDLQAFYADPQPYDLTNDVLRSGEIRRKRMIVGGGGGLAGSGASAGASASSFGGGMGGGMMGYPFMPMMGFPFMG